MCFFFVRDGDELMLFSQRSVSATAAAQAASATRATAAPAMAAAAVARRAFRKSFVRHKAATAAAAAGERGPTVWQIQPASQHKQSELKLTGKKRRSEVRRRVRAKGQI